MDNLSFYVLQSRLSYIRQFCILDTLLACLGQAKRVWYRRYMFARLLVLVFVFVFVFVLVLVLVFVVLLYKCSVV